MQYTTSVEMYVNKAQDFRSKQMWWDSNLHWVWKQTLNHFAKLAKWLSSIVNTYMYDEKNVCFYHVTYALRVNPYSLITLISRIFLLETGAIYQI